MLIPQHYQWLLNVAGIPHIAEAMKLYGTIETPGKANNARIVSWAKEIGGNIKDVYKADEIPWCGLFTAICVNRAGFALPKSPLWALAWASWGTPTKTPMLGDVVVFTRKGGGHVAFYVGEDTTHYHILGGNQGDAVNIRRRPKNTLYVAVRPNYKTTPKTVRRVMLGNTGIDSGSEA